MIRNSQIQAHPSSLQTDDEYLWFARGCDEFFHRLVLLLDGHRSIEPSKSETLASEYHFDEI